MTTVRGTQRRLSHVSPSSMVCSTARADFPAACAARGGARRTDALARLGALVALLAAWFARARALLASLCFAFASIPLCFCPFSRTPPFSLSKIALTAPVFAHPPDTNRSPPSRATTHIALLESSEIFFRCANALRWCVTLGWCVGPSYKEVDSSDDEADVSFIPHLKW